MKPNETQYRHGGNVHRLVREKGVELKDILDFSANINPLGPPEWLRSCVSRELGSILHYPDPDGSGLVTAIVKRYQVAPETVLVANGSTELLYQLPRVLECKRAVIPVPCYVDYIKVMEQAEVPVHFLPLQAEQDFRPDLDLLDSLLTPDDLLIMARPNNPTGTGVAAGEVLELARRHPRCLFLVDEAFLDFVPGGESVAGAAGNILTLNSLTKFYAIPGLRLGFGVFPQEIAERLSQIMPPWNVNSLAQKIGERALADLDYGERSRAFCHQCRTALVEKLSRLGALHLFPSEANYLLVRLDASITVQSLQEKLVDRNILIRDCSNYQGLDDRYFRIAVRNPQENEQLLEAFEDILGAANRPQKRRVRQGKTPAIMFQGTSSNAGKSVLTAALCRILLQDGIRVAPFKAQNMSLNSFVTHDGLEMGRAQVVQAQAARLDPDVRMNPVLLKPNSDTGSQVIVRGKPVGNMAVLEYVGYKAQAMEAACDCYDDLSREFQVMVLEGAGSPGEVNLKSHDIVNMRMARHAQAPVILVGDIDRGGVYASFVGTMEVLNQWERQLLAGFLVNRFRGNSSLLQDAHDYVLAHTGRPVLGVIPYLAGHGLPEEDSVSFKEGMLEGSRPQGEHVVIGLVNLPHISNFTDLEPFVEERDVYLRMVNRIEDLDSVDVIILPGSKNVIGDLLALERSGLGDGIRRKAEQGCEVVGICGGYQMLGRLISDPHKIESNGEDIPGLGLVTMQTYLAPEKTLVRKEGSHLPSGQPVVGYEIHHGLTRTSGDALFSYSDGSTCGTATEDGMVWGSYLHGLFDSDLFRRWFLDRIRVRKGLVPYDGPLASYNLEPAFDRVAAEVRRGLDMEAVYRLLRL